MADKCSGCQQMPPRYTQRVTVQRPKTTPVDAANHLDLTDDANWENVGQMMVRFVTKGGAESYVFKQTQANTTTVMFTPSTVISRQLHTQTDWRLKRGDEIYEITYSDRINKTGDEVIIEARESV